MLKSLFEFFSAVFRFLLDTLLVAVIRKPSKQNGVAIVRLDGIGDFILWLDAAKEFKRLYPKKRITLIGNQAWGNLSKLMPYWDEVITIDLTNIRNPTYRWKVLSEIRRLGFDTVIQTTYSRGFSTGDSIIRVCGGKVRLGFTGDFSNISSWKKRMSDKWYTRLVPASSESMMELQRNAEFMQGLGCQWITVHVPKLPQLLNLPSQLKIDKTYFIISPGSSWSGKLWSADRFANVLSKIVNMTGWLPVLCGSLSERALCDLVISLSEHDALNIAGETSLPELVEVIRQASILIGNDSSFVHIAAAVGTPSVCILGGGHYGRFMPYVIDERDNRAVPSPVVHKMNCFGCNWQCTQPFEKDTAMACIASISVDDVLTVVEKCLRSP